MAMAAVGPVVSVQNKPRTESFRFIGSAKVYEIKVRHATEITHV